MHFKVHPSNYAAIFPIEHAGSAQWRSRWKYYHSGSSNQELALISLKYYEPPVALTNHINGLWARGKYFCRMELFLLIYMSPYRWITIQDACSDNNSRSGINPMILQAIISLCQPIVCSLLRCHWISLASTRIWCNKLSIQRGLSRTVKLLLQFATPGLIATHLL